MDHIVILGHLVILLVGMWALFLTYQTYQRFPLTFLKSFVGYIVVFNIAVLVYLIARYAMVNVLTGVLTADDRSIAIVLLPVIIAVEVGLAYTLVQVVARLQDLENLDRINRVFALAGVVFAAGLLAGWIRLWSSDSADWLTGTASVLVLVVMMTIIGALTVTAVRKHDTMDPTRREAVRRFAYLMLLGYLPYVAFSFLPDTYALYGSVLNQLWLNCVPIIWIHRFFASYHRSASTDGKDAVLESLVREYKISRREREIMALIVAGKSNKEIEERLFISVNTVKNHIYHLYQKLGINSRGQLMHLVLRNDRIGSERS